MIPSANQTFFFPEIIVNTSDSLTRPRTKGSDYRHPARQEPGFSVFPVTTDKDAHSKLDDFLTKAAS